MPPQSDLEVASIAGFECAALSFQLPLERALVTTEDTTDVLRGWGVWGEPRQPPAAFIASLRSVWPDQGFTKRVNRRIVRTLCSDRRRGSTPSASSLWCPESMLAPTTGRQSPSRIQAWVSDEADSIFGGS